jgi:hypothetical protein
VFSTTGSQDCDLALVKEGLNTLHSLPSWCPPHSTSMAKITFTFHTVRPVPSCFNLTTAIPQIPVDVDVSGQTVLITDVSSEICFRSARLYAKRKKRVIFGARSAQKSETTAQKIWDGFESTKVKVMRAYSWESFEATMTFVAELDCHPERRNSKLPDPPRDTIYISGCVLH